MLVSRPPTPASARFATLANLNVCAALLVVIVLTIATPVPWLLFGNEGLPFVRMAVIGILLAALYLVVAVAIMIASSSPGASGSRMNDAALGQEAPTNADLVVRITQRFCPQ